MRFRIARIYTLLYDIFERIDAKARDLYTEKHKRRVKTYCVMNINVKYRSKNEYDG